MIKVLISRLKLVFNLFKSDLGWVKEVYKAMTYSPSEIESWVALKSKDGNLLTVCYNPNEKFKDSITTKDGSKWTISYKPKGDK